jgi:DNA segregation ATPase FtsK/SpoIIIE-like protein
MTITQGNIPTVRYTRLKSGKESLETAQDRLIRADKFLTAALMSEDELQTNIIDMARVFGWRVAHFRAAKTDKGWRTPVQGNKGFPDLVLSRVGVVLLVELKSETGKLSEDQELWAKAIGESYRLWRPHDWTGGVIEKELR